MDFEFKRHQAHGFHRKSPVHVRRRNHITSSGLDCCHLDSPFQPCQVLAECLVVCGREWNPLPEKLHCQGSFNDQGHCPNTLDKASDAFLKTASAALALFPDQPTLSRTFGDNTEVAVLNGTFTADPAVSFLLLGVIDDITSDHSPVLFDIFPPVPIHPLFITPVPESFNLAHVVGALFHQHMESHRVPFQDSTSPEELDALALLAEISIVAALSIALPRRIQCIC